MLSLTNRLYYRLKPFLSWRLRMALRKILAGPIRRLNQATWPIDESAARPPAGWPGWPDGKQFALVLTHDVEGPEGLAKCRPLAELELSLGFTSVFNFIPEGPYRVPDELRTWLTEHGFEVGVHDLNHDGHLFSSRTDFEQKADKINHYLHAWGSTGCRAGFMLRNLEWLHALDIAYDASTFDTDPFEPQPGGEGTIFPFFVPRDEKAGKSPKATSSTVPHHPHEGYVELPYTLPQDSTLFLLLKEPSPEIWLRKLDCIVRNGGMALVGVHPDYIQFEVESSYHDTFPVAHYRQLLQHIRDTYSSAYWHPLPREMARFVHAHRQVLAREILSSPAVSYPKKRKKIWIDLENTPHIPFFAPIIRELKKRGYDVVLTARDAYQTCEMAELYHFNYKKIGRHYGQKVLLKVFGLGIRSSQLLPFALRERPVLALNHGSRSQVVACDFLKIPSVTIMDYEHSRGTGIGHPRWMIVPQAVTEGAMGAKGTTNLLHYSGIKEDVYAPELVPDPSILSKLGLDGNAFIIVTVRPPATEAHYHNPEAEVLFYHFMERATRMPDVRVVLLPRNKRQEADIRSRWPHWFTNSKVVIPDHVVDGLNLLWHSDLAVSGGGTMNREAAALGVPVYSIFRGTIGAVDRQLALEGRLTLIESVRDVSDKIAVQRRDKTRPPDAQPRQAMTDILNHIDSIIALECR